MYSKLQPCVHQAELQDADGRGVPSAARLQRAMLLATPVVGLAPSPQLNPDPKPKPNPNMNPNPNPSNLALALALAT